MIYFSHHCKKPANVGGPLLVINCTCISGSWLKCKNIQGGMISLWNHLVFLLLQRTSLKAFRIDLKNTCSIYIF